MKRKITSTLILSALLLSGCSLPSLFGQKNAAIQIETTPKAEVFINDEKVGETPFKSQQLKSEDYDIRLVPQGEGLIEWETTVTLHPGITTVISYDFSQDRQQSSGAILTLEPLADNQAVEIAVVSIPDNASVTLNGQPKGFTPLQVKNVDEGEHTLSVSAPGFKQQQIKIKTVKGYKLTVEAQLARKPLELEETQSTPSAEPEDEDQLAPTPTEKEEASPSAVSVEKPYIEILDTPTGWLRVREEPTTAEDNQLAKVNPGEKYPYLDTNDTGWHQIKLEDGTKGWISGRYAKLVK